MKSNTLILQTGARLIIPVQLLFSLFLLIRGHNEPGGGFIAGLVAAAAFVLYLFAFGVAEMKSLMRVDSRDLLGFGLLVALASGIPALVQGSPFLTGLWYSGPAGIKLSTPLLFDIGVYFAVQGTLLTFVVALAEAEE